MNPFQGVLHLLADPNIAFILFTLGFYGPALRAPEPELRDRDPRRARDHPRVHRLRQPAAQPRRAPADRARRSSCSCSRRPSPATACSRSADRLLRAGRVRAVHQPGDADRAVVAVALPVIIVTHGADRRPDGPDHARGHPDAAHGAARRAPSASRSPLGHRGRRPGAARAARHRLPGRRGVDAPGRPTRGRCRAARPSASSPTTA